MKNILLTTLLMLFIIGNPAIAEGDLWDNFGDQNQYGTSKYVSDKDFQKAIDAKRGEKKPKKVKGETFHQGDETTVINDIPKELPVVCVTSPVKVMNDAILPVGHYQIVGEKRENKIFLKLYQGHYLIVELEATETLDDFDEPEINFANFIASGSGFKLIYGSIDYNAFVELESVQTDELYSF